jgi:alkylation response protein AidB-like acyl-CoA dehydrogenase
MQLAYNDDHRMLSETLERFVTREYAFETRDAAANSETGYSPGLWSQFAELGIIGALFDEEAGGFGGSGADIALVFEGIGKGIVAEPFHAVLRGGTCLAAGNDAQRALLENVIAGESLVTLACCEAGSDYVADRVGMTATRDGDGWVLDGSKIAVPFGGVADTIVVSARTSGDTRDRKGISLFVVPRSAAGISGNTFLNVDGGASADLAFEQVRVGDDALLGNADDGYAILDAALNRGLLALSAESLGVMTVTADMTVDYLRERKQFGVHIGSFQALQHRIVEVIIAIEQARSAVANAASALDEDEKTAARTLSAAKYTTGHTGRRTAEEAIQMFGGNGMIWEVPVAHYAKRLVMIDHELGDEDFHLQRYIALGDA